MKEYRCTYCETIVGGNKAYKHEENYVCQSCYNYFKRGGVIHPLPPKGEVHYDKEGRIICHVCGMSYHKLIGHARQKHGLNERAYKKRFGLDRRGLLSEKSRELARRRVYENPHVIETLIQEGRRTRFKKNSRGRVRSMMSLQTIKRMTRRYG